MREFQTKIVHRFYPSQNIVSKWDDNTSSICNICNKETANVLHTFFTCCHVKHFWEDIQKNIFEKCNSITVNCENVILGIVPYNIRIHSINHCIMYGKYFIHKERKRNLT